MNVKKKIFYSIMAVVYTATMSIGFTSCSKDEKPAEVDWSFAIMKKWRYYLMTPCNYIEFKSNGTYIYETPNGIIEGNYRITETQNTKTGYYELFYEADTLAMAYKESDATLFKMLVSGSRDFDQLWVYYYRNELSYIQNSFQINVDIYANNELKEQQTYIQVTEWTLGCE